MARMAIELEVTRKEWVGSAIRASGNALGVLSFVLPERAVDWLRNRIVVPVIIRFGYSIEVRV